MNVTVIGTGNMARAVATRALAGGHHVTFVGTHLSKALDLADELTGEGRPALDGQAALTSASRIASSIGTRLAACRQTRDRAPSMTCEETSCPRRAGRQCMNTA
jgi:glutamyl-tRNA reductase